MLLPVSTAVTLPALSKQVRMESISFRSLPIKTSVNIIAFSLQRRPHAWNAHDTHNEGKVFFPLSDLGEVWDRRNYRPVSDASKLRAGALTWDHEFRCACKRCEEECMNARRRTLEIIDVTLS